MVFSGVVIFPATTSMMSRKILANLPDPGKVERVADVHAAFGNSTDRWLLGWPMMHHILSVFHHNRTPAYETHFRMNKNLCQTSRRQFFTVSAITGLSMATSAWDRRKNWHSMTLGDKVIIRQVTRNGKHPIMDNPHSRNQQQVDALVERARQITAATGVKLMCLASLLKQPIAPSE